MSNDNTIEIDENERLGHIAINGLFLFGCLELGLGGLNWWSTAPTATALFVNLLLMVDGVIKIGPWVFMHSLAICRIQTALAFNFIFLLGNFCVPFLFWFLTNIPPVKFEAADSFIFMLYILYLNVYWYIISLILCILAFLFAFRLIEIIAKVCK